MKRIIGGSMEGQGCTPHLQWQIQGGRPRRQPLLRPKIFSISCSFSENLAKSYVGASRPQGLRSSYRESWIRPCSQDNVFIPMQFWAKIMLNDRLAHWGWRALLPNLNPPPRIDASVADPGGVPKGPWLPPSPVQTSHKKDGHQRRPHRFHVSCPPPHPAAGSDAVPFTTVHVLHFLLLHEESWIHP